MNNKHSVWAVVTVAALGAVGWLFVTTHQLSVRVSVVETRMELAIEILKELRDRER